MKVFNLKISWFGLGDHLLFSHLPRIAKQAHNYDKVYITNDSPYRNFQAKNLIWELNPFVDGFCDEIVIMPKQGQKWPGINMMDKIMLVNGLDDGLTFHNPEIYYKPKIIPELTDAVIYDPNFGTNCGYPSTSLPIKNYFKQNNINITHQMRSLHNDKKFIGKALTSRSIDCDKELQDKNLKHFCDMLYSCKALYCFNSGVSVLAAALGKPAVIFHTSRMKAKFLDNFKMHTYVELEE